MWEFPERREAGQVWEAPPPTPLPRLLGQGGIQQLEDAAHQVQAACDQHVDGSGLSEHAGPAVCHGVGEKVPWGTGCLKDRVPALADPLQSMGDAAEDEGAGAVGVGRAGCQQQGCRPTSLRAGAAPEVRAGRLLGQAAPVLLVFQAAEQHLVQGHHEVLLVCRAQGRRISEAGGGRASALWTPA